MGARDRMAVMHGSGRWLATAEDAVVRHVSQEALAFRQQLIGERALNNFATGSKASVVGETGNHRGGPGVVGRDTLSDLGRP